ncbi:MAG: hypothetical protein CL808_02710 [Citromicrobium sp.]|nr:hypothetical protein [Citromicrobium sp.]
MRSRTVIVLALSISAFALSGCAKNYEPEASLSVRAQVSQAPRFATPPAELMRRPEILDFLPTEESLPKQVTSAAPPKSSSSETSSPHGRLFSSKR